MGTPEKEAPEADFPHPSVQLLSPCTHCLLRDSHSCLQYVPIVAALHLCPMNVCTHFKFKEIG